MPVLTVGGQAVLEGVMIRAPGIMTVAVRLANGSIIVRKDMVRTSHDSCVSAQIPVIRGIRLFVHSLFLGFKALDYSTVITLRQTDTYLHTDTETSPADSWRQAEYATSPGRITVSLIAIAAIGLLTFLLLPFLMTQILSATFDLFHSHSFLFNLAEGFIRMIILAGYVFLISLFPEINRVFQYHGAEHKTIHAYEAGVELSVENVRQFSRFHPRCGSAFLFYILFGSIVVFSFLPAAYPVYAKVAFRLLIFPLMAGSVYEVLRIACNSYKKPFKLFAEPGLWLQRMTTREPSDDQLEVSILALRTALKNADSKCNSPIF